MERYSLKDCIIINNLPLVHGTNYWEHVLFFSTITSILKFSTVACHALGPIKTQISRQHSLFTTLKDRVYGRKHFLRDQHNPINLRHIFLNERWTIRDVHLMDRMNGLGVKTNANPGFS